MTESMLLRLIENRSTPDCFSLRAERHFYTVSVDRGYAHMTDSPALADPSEKRVLVVDDDDDLRDLMKLILSQEGFQVECAVDGKEALDAVERSKPDLIVLDLMLPRYGGYEVLRRLQEGEAARIPIFVVTGRYKDLNTANMIREESNVVEFLEKPVPQATLTAKAHKTLGTRPRRG